MIKSFFLKENYMNKESFVVRSIFPDIPVSSSLVFSIPSDVYDAFKDQHNFSSDTIIEQARHYYQSTDFILMYLSDKTEEDLFLLTVDNSHQMLESHIYIYRREFYGASREFLAIKKFYGDRCAKRSGVPLINHIIDGIAILSSHGGSERAINAFCIHPIVQNNEDVDVSWSYAYDLAEEYAIKANRYLCRPENDHINTPDQVMQLVGPMSNDCRLMLLADKIQNRKDFEIYHKDSHERSDQLTRYFNLWIESLDTVFK